MTNADQVLTVYNLGWIVAAPLEDAQGCRKSIDRFVRVISDHVDQFTIAYAAEYWLDDIVGRIHPGWCAELCNYAVDFSVSQEHSYEQQEWAVSALLYELMWVQPELAKDALAEMISHEKGFRIAMDALTGLVARPRGALPSWCTSLIEPFALAAGEMDQERVTLVLAACAHLPRDEAFRLLNTMETLMPADYMQAKSELQSYYVELTRESGSR